ncbi:hypothetical protein TSUD_12620 [Trifolium subterraneum]|uniref:Uncharacterized protein n=1 Tax=Trifolium subterraneum TaxID=3900 RepID=A0A2Z6PL03_TRISU|nr:hypothetical protein TSUD_12620 [Trifolium subterraneum]
MAQIAFDIIYCLASKEICVMLRLVFLGLYVLAEDRNCSVEDVAYWSEGVWHWNMSWRCALWRLEEPDRAELIQLLDRISPNARLRISGFGCWIRIALVRRGLLDPRQERWSCLLLQRR